MIERRWGRLILILILPALCVSLTRGNEFPAEREPDPVFAFAESLEAEGEYYRAITEYKRVIFLHPSSREAEYAWYHIGICYLEGRRYHAAVETLSRQLSDNEDPETCLTVISRYALSEALYHLNRYDEAVAQLSLLPAVSRRYIQPFSIRYACLWNHLEMRDASAVETDLAQLSRELPESQAVDLRRHVEAVLHHPRKKPWLAGGLSVVVPGAGQFYAGRWRDGLISLLVNGLFIGGMVHAIQNDHDETAAVLGFFEAGWYAANIYNAINDAHKYNRDQWANHLKLLDTAFGPPYRRPAGCPNEP